LDTDGLLIANKSTDAKGCFEVHLRAHSVYHQVARGRLKALHGKIYSAILRYISGAIYAGSPPASPNSVNKFECRMEHDACTPLAK